MKRRRPPPELHVVLTFESSQPTVRLVSSTAEDQQRIVSWLRERPAALLRVEAAVLALISSLLDEEPAA